MSWPEAQQQVGGYAGAKFKSSSRADTGGVDDDRAAVRQHGFVREFCDMFDHLRVGCTEGEAFDVAQVVVRGRPVSGCEKVRRSAVAAFEDGDGGEVVLLG